MRVLFSTLTVLTFFVIGGMANAGCVGDGAMEFAARIASEAGSSKTDAAENATRVAAQNIVTLRVTQFGCASCEYMLNTALSKVPGVRGVNIEATDDATVVLAHVNFVGDPERARDLADAATNVGFPSTVVYVSNRG